MKKVIVVFVVLGILGTGLVLGKNNDTSVAKNEVNAAVQEKRTFEQIQNDVKAGAVLYDVRTPEEYADGHFNKAINWSLIGIQAGQYPAVDKDTKIYLYCRSGSRSAQAKDLLEKAGFTQVIDLGGLDDVKKLGGVVQK